ncbi:MAG: hypothetical protein ACKOHK_09610, partial [Planctomycetia bacterium]
MGRRAGHDDDGQHRGEHRLPRSTARLADGDGGNQQPSRREQADHDGQRQRGSGRRGQRQHGAQDRRPAEDRRLGEGAAAGKPGSAKRQRGAAAPERPTGAGPTAAGRGAEETLPSARAGQSR